VCQGLTDRAKQFYEEDNSVIHDVDNQGGNIVILAATYGKIEILEWIKKDLFMKEIPRKKLPENATVEKNDSGKEKKYRHRRR